MTRNISETNVINCYWMKLCNMVKILTCISKCTVTSSSYQHNAIVTSGVLYCYFLLYFQIYCNIFLSYTFKSTYIIYEKDGLGLCAQQFIVKTASLKSKFRCLKYEDTSRPMYGDHDPQALIII
jgi:hypothetical protein